MLEDNTHSATRHIPGRVVVTGGAGFIGANLCRELLATGVSDVTVLDDLSTGIASNLDGLAVNLVVGSILDTELLAEAVAGADSIVHLAARPSVPRSILDPVASHTANATGTLNVLEAARKELIHTVVASSSSVYGSNPILPKVESLRCMPASPYAVSKLAAESYTTAYSTCFGVPTLAFRFFNVYGPLQAAGHAYAAVVPAFIDAALAGQPLQVYGDGEQSRDFTYVGTVVSALTQTVLGRVVSADPVNLAFGTRTTLNELIKIIAAQVGDELEVVRSDQRVGDVRHSQASSERLRSLLPALRPIALDQGIAGTVKWFREALSSRGVASSP